MAMNKLPSDIP